MKPPVFRSMSSKPYTSKREVRLEKKVKKMAAYMKISKLNDKDREAKSQRRTQDSASSGFNSTEQPCRKKKRVDNENEDGSNSETTLSAEKQADDVETPVKQLTKEQYAQLKQELKNRKNILKNRPRLTLKNAGESASLSTVEGSRIPLFLVDVQHLLLYSILGNRSPYLPSRWASLEKFNKISHTVVIVVEGISLYHFSSYETLFTSVNDIFQNRVEIITPAVNDNDILKELATVPLTSSQQAMLIREYGTLEKALLNHKDSIVMIEAFFPIKKIVKRKKSVEEEEEKERSTNEDFFKKDKFPRTKLLLSAWQMVEKDYPLPLKGELSSKYSHYVFTKSSYEEVTPHSPMFGLDCEMCLTVRGYNELTRISIVDEAGKTIYDRLVKPLHPITNYLTQYSGITKSMLKNVTHRLADVQEDIRKLLPSDAILVGQSLNCDLHALEMMHPYCIDTGVIYNLTGERTRTPGLKLLAREFLDSKIQEGNSGHDSIEDSLTSLRLVQLKLANSVDFGDAILSGVRHSKPDEINSLESNSLEKSIDRKETNKSSTDTSPTASKKWEFKVELSEKTKVQFGTSIFKHVSSGATPRSSLIVGCEEVTKQYETLINLKNNEDPNNKVTCINVKSNKDVIKKTCRNCMENGFTMAHIKVSTENVEHPNAEETVRDLDKSINDVWSHVAVNGLCVVVFGGQVKSNGACFLQIKTTPLTKNI